MGGARGARTSCSAPCVTHVSPSSCPPPPASLPRTCHPSISHFVLQGFGFDEDEDDVDRLAKRPPPPRSPVRTTHGPARVAASSSPRASGHRPPGTAREARRTSVESLSGFGGIPRQASEGSLSGFGDPSRRTSVESLSGFGQSSPPPKQTGSTAARPSTAQSTVGSPSTPRPSEDKVAVSRRRSLERSVASAEKRRQEEEDKEETRRLKQHAEHLVRLVTSSPSPGRPRSDSTYSSQRSWPMIHPAARAPADFALLQSTMAGMRVGSGGSSEGPDLFAAQHRRDLPAAPPPVSRNGARRASTVFSDGVMHTVEEAEAGGADDDRSVVCAACLSLAWSFCAPTCGPPFLLVWCGVETC
jgi:hypothetical protein